MKTYKPRLKYGVLTVFVGSLIQVFIEINRISQEIVNSGALITCLTYGTIGNDCEEKYSIVSNLIGWIIAFIGFLIIIGHFTGKIAHGKGRDYSSFFLLGFFFGLIGLLIALLIGEKIVQKVEVMKPQNIYDDVKKCKFCAEEIKIEAIFCKHCKNNLE